MSAGRFIALEGGEGVGKSTQAKLLAQALEARGLDVVLTREPGGTPGAEAIRTLLLEPPEEMRNDGWTPQSEALLFAAARADHVARRIRPALAAGQWVVCDRFLDSSRAYQGGGGGLDDADILALHAIGSGGLLPELTIVIGAPEDSVADRLAARDGDESDAIGGRAAAYHERVAAAFARFAAAEPERFAAIDGGGTPEEVHARIVEAVARLIEGPS